MVKLERTMSAGISANRCLTFEEIERYVADGSLGERLIATDEAIDYMPDHTVVKVKAAAALQGQRLSLSMISPPVTDSQPFRLYKEDRTFLGVYGRDESGAIAPIKVFLP